MERHLRLVPQAWLSLQSRLQNLTPTDSFPHITHGFPLSVSSLWLSLSLRDATSLLVSLGVALSSVSGVIIILSCVFSFCVSWAMAVHVPNICGWLRSSQHGHLFPRIFMEVVIS